MALVVGPLEGTGQETFELLVSVQVDDGFPAGSFSEVSVNPLVVISDVCRKFRLFCV